ncbi:putative signal peptide-containing protein plus transmembrane domain near C-terminus [Cryptosporidium canis]|uniref:Signal peptide-containing protein plus transmembrane domain near C-terminus n=1 Tax=Cryptosporidium canis TaxID=195482 RepID=A0A9D5DMK6_9CRYT|nr:putative signal peptide-containing protein plus transmembrane domain near C-terminus [Cryptosporidium canis]
MIKYKHWYWILIFALLYIQVDSAQDENFNRVATSYVTGIDENFYPFVPQIFLMMGREQMITDFFDSFENILERLPGTANLWMFESIKEEIAQVKDRIGTNIMQLMDKHKVRLTSDQGFESFRGFQRELEGYYREFGLERGLQIYTEIEIIGNRIAQYQSTGSGKVLDEIEKRWSYLQDRAELSDKGGSAGYKLKKRVCQLLTDNFLITEGLNRGEVDISRFSSDFSGKFWSSSLSNYGLLEFFREYGVEQLNLIYRLKLIWFRMTLTIGIINLEGFLNSVHKLASNTVVHSISLTSLQYLYQIKDRIDFFLLNESYLDKLLEMYENLSATMNKWMGQTLVLDDLQYLYAHLMKEGLDIRTLVTDLFDIIKHYGERELIVFERRRRGKKKVSGGRGGFLSYLSTEWDISNSEKKAEGGRSREDLVFRRVMELRANSELELEIMANRNLYEDHVKFNLFLERLETRYMRFVRQSRVFLEELDNTSQNCQTLYFSASQTGSMIYEIVANEILNTSNRPGRINMNSNKQLKSLIKDLESVKESIDSVKETEEDRDATDILGESVSDEDFIYVPGTVGNFKKSPTTSGYLIIRISVIISLLILAIILYMYKDRILVRKMESEEEAEAYERYCSRVSLDEVEFSSSQNNESKRMKKNKYYRVDSKSGNIILRQQK